MAQRKRAAAQGVPASFEVRVNGKRVAVVGMKGNGGISTGVSAWSPRSGRTGIAMYMGATDANDAVWDRLYFWPAPRLGVEDEITIRVVRPTRPHKPKLMARIHRVEGAMAGPEDSASAVVRNVSVWAGKRTLLLRARDRSGNSPRLTAKAARKVAKALEHAADQLERRRARE